MDISLKNELSRKYIEMHACLLLPVLLAIKLTLHCHMCDLHSKFEEDLTKNTVAIVDNRCCGQICTHTHIYMHCIGQTITSVCLTCQHSVP